MKLHFQYLIFAILVDNMLYKCVSISQIQYQTVNEIHFNLE